MPKIVFCRAVLHIVSVLILLNLIPPTVQSETVDAYLSYQSTFHSMGVYWNPPEASNANKCLVDYRVNGSNTWNKALPLWFDSDGLGGYPAGYRGSLVNLTPGTSYQVRLTLSSSDTERIFTAGTWSEDFPIARTEYLPSGTSTSSLSITESGSPNGYILYTHRPGEQATIDVNNQEDSSIFINASYIIIRGLTLKGARAHGIELLENAHDVIIEKSDISGWGRHREGEWGRQLDAAIYSEAPDLQRVIIQRNKLHHPRYDTNSWTEDGHPEGPQAIVFKAREGSLAGHHVIRYNEIYSDDDHYFNDSMGNDNNSTYHGFPFRDTDIYGNSISHCWDDGIESEGANVNVRIWGNYITRTPIKIATRSITIGPLYIWRNVFNISRKSPTEDYGWSAFKAGNSYDLSAGGAYIFHNTILQPDPPDEGSSGGINSGSGAIIGNMTSRNNILHGSSSSSKSIFNSSPNSSNDFDYDLYNGTITAMAGSEAHGIKGVPSYVAGAGFNSTTGQGIFELSSSSLGFDAGAVIPNFNDDYRGSAPDTGAHEGGSPPMEFGVNAYNSPTPLLGDVSGDGQVTSYDAALTGMYAVGVGDLTPEQIKAADVTGNSEVSSYDAALIAQYVVGLIEKFPAEE